MTIPLQIAVTGGASCDQQTSRLAHEVGTRLALEGVTLICGGREGVMAAASRGAYERGGTTVGILPGADADDSPPNPFLRVHLFSGIGQARNLAVVLSAAAVIAIGGGWGTLSEIALALKHRIPVVLLSSWSLTPPAGPDSLLFTADSAAEAVGLALEHAIPGRLTPNP